MNFCPECGSAVSFDRLEQDVATDHYYYICVSGGHKWEETMDKSGELMHIAPVSEGEGGGEQQR